MLIPIIPNTTGKTYKELAAYHDCSYEQFVCALDSTNPEFDEYFAGFISTFYHEDGEVNCFEHNTPFGDKDLIAAVLDEAASENYFLDWNGMPKFEQHLAEREFAMIMPTETTEGWYVNGLKKSKIQWFQRYQRT